MAWGLIEQHLNYVGWYWEERVNNREQIAILTAMNHNRTEF